MHHENHDSFFPRFIYFATFEHVCTIWMSVCRRTFHFCGIWFPINFFSVFSQKKNAVCFLYIILILVLINFSEFLILAVFSLSLVFVFAVYEMKRFRTNPNWLVHFRGNWIHIRYNTFPLINSLKNAIKLRLASIFRFRTKTWLLLKYVVSSNDSVTVAFCLFHRV